MKTLARLPMNQTVRRTIIVGETNALILDIISNHTDSNCVLIENSLGTLNTFILLRELVLKLLLPFEIFLTTLSI